MGKNCLHGLLLFSLAGQRSHLKETEKEFKALSVKFRRCGTLASNNKDIKMFKIEEG